MSCRRKNAEKDSEVKDAIQLETEIVPPDGGWGWIVCLAAFLTNFTVQGIVAVNGIIFLGLLELFNDSISKTTLVCSIIAGTSMFGGPLVSVPLMFKASHRQIMMVAGITGAASAVASSFVPNIETLMFTYGILAGLSLAVNYFAVNVIVGHYFKKKRVLAIGIANSGTGFGAFVLNYLTDKSISFYGMRGTFLLFGGLFLNLTVYGALCRPLKSVSKQSPDSSESRRTSTDKKRGVANRGLEPEEENSKTQDKKRGVANLRIEPEEENSKTQDEKCDVSNGHSTDEIEPLPKMLRMRMSITSEITPSEFDNRKTRYCDATMFKNKYFCLLLAIYLLHGGNSTYIYIPTYAVSVGLSREEAALIMSINGIIAIIIQMLVGFLADITNVPISYLLLTALASLSLGTMLIPFCKTFATIALGAIICSIGMKIGISLRIAMIAALLGIEKMSAAYSIMSTLIGMVYLIYPVVKGSIFEATQYFPIVFYLDSASAFLGAVLSCGIVYAQKKGKFIE